MPNDIKATLSVVTLIVAAAIAYWEFGNGRSDLSWVIGATGVFMVIAMWVFPETEEKSSHRKKS